MIRTSRKVITYNHIVISKSINELSNLISSYVHNEKFLIDK